MRKLSVFLISVMSCCCTWLGVRAQDTNAGVIYFQHRTFTIPFNHEKNASIARLRLFVSSDQGRTWQQTAEAAPEHGYFRFSTAQDGFFWFAVQTEDGDGKVYPPMRGMLAPSMKIIVDTVPPSVQVRPLLPRNGEVGVAWLVRDENGIDTTLPDAVQLVYRYPGSSNWLTLPIGVGSSQHYWNPHTSAPIEVRVLARDRAGNIGEDKTTVSLSNAKQPVDDPFFNHLHNANHVPSDLERKYVNSKEISLLYDLSDVGPSGVSQVELWYTRYKERAWNKLAAYPIDSKNLPEGKPSKKLPFKVENEGVYGFTLVARSGVGLGDQPPKVGDAPQFWLEVDTTKPVVRILDVSVGNGLDKGKLTVTWSAQDKNFGAQPIRLSYSEQKDGGWKTCADKLPNQGRYVWTMPEPRPYQFYLRLEATDLAGNVGQAVTAEKVKVDLSLPKAKVLGVEVGK